MKKPHNWKIEKGAFTLKVGHASDEISATVSIVILEDHWMEGKEREFFAKAEVN